MMVTLASSRPSDLAQALPSPLEDAKTNAFLPETPRSIALSPTA